jgi:predicted amidohydrolase YtcJ
MNPLARIFHGLCFLPALASAAAPADLVVRGANILTVATNRPRAEAFAVAGGEFVAVGRAEDMAPFLGPHTKILELAGKTIVPGFNDAHLHPSPVYPPDSRWAAVDCSPRNVHTMDELIVALQRKAARTPPGQWVNGSRYQETKLGRQPTRHDLDRASTNHPILISHSSGHQSVCNSLALQLAQVTRDTKDPPGGKFGRDARGEPTGLLQESAASLVRTAGPRSPSPPEAETVAGYQECFRGYFRHGLTSVQVAGAGLSAARLMEKARTDELPLRLYVMLRESSLDEAVRRHRDARADDPLRFGAIKIFHGNSLSAQTCWLSQPYADRPDYFGVPPARSQEALDQLILKIHTNGLQVAVHSNGDREIEMVVTAFERALAQVPRPGHRHRIEHGSVLTASLLPRLRAAGLVVVPHSYLWEHGDKMESYGAWRWDWMHAARTLLDHGIPIAGHSDAPVSAAEPLLRIQDMVTRTSAEGKVYGASQRIRIEEALRAWTLGAAFAEFAEDRKGSITVGKLADFVVLAADPARVKPDAIKDIAIEKTFIGGQAVFEAK